MVESSDDRDRLRWAERIADGEVPPTDDAADGPSRGFRLLWEVAHAFREREDADLAPDHLDGARPETDSPSTDGPTLGSATTVPSAAAPSIDVPSLGPGSRIGPFELQAPLGEGGMGVVWKAKRAEGDFSQTVALKLLRSGAGAHPLARFRQERRILAGLEHPGIARLVDGGTTAAGRPWMAMEFVEGREITDHCDALLLSVDERIRLVARVARILDAAHRRLVVHRDLKPSNILVTPEGEPRLLDFGIAKLLADEKDSVRNPGLTRTDARPMTPLYASPEQLRGEPVTVASDVYQLGLLLHELLTGRRAHRLTGASWAAWEREICETPPRRPSTEALATTDAAFPAPLESDPGERARLRRARPEELSRQLRGDLDTIVAKALALEPDRRYRTALDLCEDLERHLEGRPVRARPATFRYRFGKALRRHPLQIGALATAVVVVVGLTALYTALLVRQRDAAESARLLAEERRVAAETARDEASQVSDFLVELFEAADPYRNLGDEVTARQLLEEGTARLASGAIDRPAVRSRLLETVGWVHYRLARYGEAARLLREAITLESPSTPVEDRIRIRERLGSILWRDSHLEEAEAVLDEALELHREAWGLDDPRADTLLFRAGNLLLSQGRHREAEERLQQLLENRFERAGEHPDLIPLLNNIGIAQSDGGRPEAAIESFRRGLSIVGSRTDARHPDIARLHINLGTALRRLGRLEEARSEMEVARAMRERIYDGEHPANAEALFALGQVEWEMGVAEGEARMRTGLAMRRRIHGDTHPVVAISLVELAERLNAEGRLAEARRSAREAIPILEGRDELADGPLARARTLAK